MCVDPNPNQCSPYFSHFPSQRQSTDFPDWLRKPETKEKLQGGREGEMIWGPVSAQLPHYPAQMTAVEHHLITLAGKTVLMYCTGGIR